MQPKTHSPRTHSPRTLLRAFWVGLALMFGAMTIAAPATAQTATAQQPGQSAVASASANPAEAAAKAAARNLPMSFTTLKGMSSQTDPALSAAQKHQLLNRAMETHNLLSLAWALALALSVGMYLILDGADLGAGVLSLFHNDNQTRDGIMAAMAGTWDANETWLIVAGGILFGGFPLVYGSIFHYLALPLAILLLAILVRAISIEFHHHAERSKRWWGFGFGFGSLVTAFGIGLAGGAVLQGVPLTNVHVTYAGGGIHRVFEGGLFDCITPFSLWCGVAGVIASVMAGALYLRARFTLDSPQRHIVKPWLNVSMALLVVSVVISGIWMFSAFDWVSARWAGPFWWAFALAGLWIVFTVWKMWEAAHRDRDLESMLWYAVATASVMLTVGLTLFPWLVPGTWTIYDAADPSLSLLSFTLAMGGFFPVILVYNWYQIWVFRARISALGSYGAH
ncbi:cytochrome d ubiquinol oxidase subunit II [Acidimangrovimonas sediminis]|uniref:cytochrome d ubiquinol oxidase subunit II n=1 Tax=Acidimangrovimonas sediminis TaxID=2056283 RepID=UPI0018EDA67D|nr:cytochrome d ubiquinol oxidase subunit II [Acidimangrovimonas sediminis]